MLVEIADMAKAYRRQMSKRPALAKEMIAMGIDWKPILVQSAWAVHHPSRVV